MKNLFIPAVLLIFGIVAGYRNRKTDDRFVSISDFPFAH